MKENKMNEYSHILEEIKCVKRELENLKSKKSELKLKLFYDSQNSELLNELESVKNHNQELNERLSKLNNQLLTYLNNKTS